MTLREWIIAAANARAYWDADTYVIDDITGHAAHYVRLGHGHACIVIPTDVFSSRVVYDAI